MDMASRKSRPCERATAANMSWSARCTMPGSLSSPCTQLGSDQPHSCSACTYVSMTGAVRGCCDRAAQQDGEVMQHCMQLIESRLLELQAASQLTGNSEKNLHERSLSPEWCGFCHCWSHRRRRQCRYIHPGSKPRCQHMTPGTPARRSTLVVPFSKGDIVLNQQHV